MSSRDMMRRAGRDRRDAGAYRKVERARRERDLSRWQARELKGRAVAWSDEASAAPTRVVTGPSAPVPAACRCEPCGSVAAPPPAILDEAVVLPIGGRVAASDLSWLPQVGTPVVVAGVRIAAVKVAGGHGEPFYVLTGAV